MSASGPALPEQSAEPSEGLKRTGVIREKLANVKQVLRDNELTVWNPSHHASWNDIEFLLDAIDALRQQVTLREGLFETLKVNARRDIERLEAEAVVLRRARDREGEIRDAAVKLQDQLLEKNRALTGTVARLREALIWALKYAEASLRSQHIHSSDRLETCTSPQCAKFRELVALTASPEDAKDRS